jgi:hypothetical protein
LPEPNWHFNFYLCVWQLTVVDLICKLDWYSNHGAFDDKHYMVDADVVEGSRLSVSIPAMLQDPGVAYLHLHNA